MRDGYLNKCKDCTKADSAATAAKKANDPEWVEAEIIRQREKSRRQRAEGKTKPISPAKAASITKNYRENHPEKYKAHKIVRAAIKAKSLIPQPCETCSKPAQAHHDDYSKPLDVIWLCPEHHAARHVAIRKQQRSTN